MGGGCSAGTKSSQTPEGGNFRSQGGKKKLQRFKGGGAMSFARGGKRGEEHAAGGDLSWG